MDGIFNGAFIVPLLALITLLGVLVLAMRSQKEVLERKRDPNAPKSTLAADAADHTASGKPVE